MFAAGTRVRTRNEQSEAAIPEGVVESSFERENGQLCYRVRVQRLAGPSYLREGDLTLVPGEELELLS
jgi:hypothetical protein